MEVIVTPYGNEPKLVTKAESLVRDGYAADVWVLCERILASNGADMLVQLRNEDGDNWLIEEKGLGTAVLQQDCIAIEAEHQTENAVLVGRYATPGGQGTESGLHLRDTLGDIWLPKSQITSFELKSD